MTKVFGHYHVERMIGRGGMGEVYEAIHSQIQRRAAIKVLSAHFAEDPKVAARFLNEARAVNIISHPSLVNIYEFGQEGGTPYIVMEYLEGETLLQRLRSSGSHGIDSQSAMHIIRQIASGLAAAHEKGIIHRDLKPTNFMIVPDPETPNGERVKILDFGIAKILEPSGDDAKLTDTGSLLGTPTYMSPEQCRNARDVTDRSDIYSLGVMAYEMLTGQQPYRGRNDIDTIMRHRSFDPPPIRSVVPGVPKELDDLVQSMLRKAPAERPSAVDVNKRLSSLLRGASLSGSMAPVAPVRTATASQESDTEGVADTVAEANPALLEPGVQSGSPEAQTRAADPLSRPVVRESTAAGQVRPGGGAALPIPQAAPGNSLRSKASSDQAVPVLKWTLLWVVFGISVVLGAIVYFLQH